MLAMWISEEIGAGKPTLVSNYSYIKFMHINYYCDLEWIRMRIARFVEDLIIVFHQLDKLHTSVLPL